MLACLPDTGPHYECDNKHVSSNKACKLTNCIIEMFLNLNQSRGGKKKGGKGQTEKKQHSLDKNIISEVSG